MIITTEDGDTALDIKDKLEEVVSCLMSKFPSKYEIIIKKPTRSLPQNRSMHDYFERVSIELNKAGFTKNKVFALLKDELPWDAEGVKRDLWCVFQKHLGLGEKTSKMKTSDVTKVYDLCNLFLSLHINLPYIPFTKEEL